VRTFKVCSPEQFELATTGRNYTPARLGAARRVMVDRRSVDEVAEEFGLSAKNVYQAVHLIWKLVQALPVGEDPDRPPRPGFVILSVEVRPDVAKAIKTVAQQSGGAVMGERKNG
jgi:hypothetical protein